MQKDFDKFKQTLKDSIKDWEYFVNWKKVFSNKSEMEITLNKMNYLLGKENFEAEFEKLHKSNKDIIKAIPVLLAIRSQKIEIFDNLKKEAELFDFTKTDNDYKIYLNFLQKTGLEALFKKDGVKNLVDYVLGIEVGLDSNGRKNRSGNLMEKIVKIYVEDFCNKNSLSYLSQATATKIKEAWGVDIKSDKTERRFDFAIFNPTNKKLKLIEANFYGTSGSKLKAVCGEFMIVHNILKEQNIDFIWITDGLGWASAFKPLEEAFMHNDFVFNLHMMEKNILQDIEW